MLDVNIFLLCVRNLVLKADDKRLQEIFSTVTGRKVRVKKVLIIQGRDRVDSSGHGQSVGYGCVEFTDHKDALAALRATNYNPDIQWRRSLSAGLWSFLGEQSCCSGEAAAFS